MNIQQIMFDSFDHFKQVVMTYGRSVFSGKEINDEMLTFIVRREQECIPTSITIGLRDGYCP